MGSWTEMTQGKAVAGGPSKVVDFRVGCGRQQMPDTARQRLVEQEVPHSHADKPGRTTEK